MSGDREDCCGRASVERCRCYTPASPKRFARSWVGARRRQDVEDITQDALLRLYRSADSLRDERALEAWMYRIADSAIIDHYRRSALRPEPISPEDVALMSPENEDMEPRADAELAECLHPLLARLPDDYRTALELTDLGELTQEQAAAELGPSTSGMKSRVQRGRRMLRTEVGRCCRIELDERGALADASIRDGGAAC